MLLLYTDLPQKSTSCLLSCVFWLADNTHDVILDIVFGQQIHAAIPNDFIINNGIMLTVILNKFNVDSGISQIFQESIILVVFQRTKCNQIELLLPPTFSSQ